MKQAAMLAVVVLSAAPVLADWDDDCRYTANRRATTPASGVTRIVMRTGPGSLTVEGARGAAQIVASGTACTSDESFLQNINVTLRKVGTELHIDSTMPEKNVIFGFSSARLDLGITLPAGIPVEIEDGSGSMKISNTGPTRIEDGSGSIEVRDITGDLSIEDGSGEMTIRNVAGDVEIEDGSGSIDLVGIEGSVQLREDGSGSISVRDVRGDVGIGRDGSGSIEVADVRGNFSVGRKGSGHIDHARVGGKVEVPNRH